MGRYTDYQRAYRRSLLSRSRTSLTRLRKLSQASLKKSREVIGRSKLRESTGPDSDTDRETRLNIIHRRASSESSSDASNSPRTPHHPSALLLETEPFTKPELTGEIPPQVCAVAHIVTEPDDLALVSSTTRPSRAKSISSSLKRLRTLSKASLFSGARRHAPQVCQILPAESSGTRIPHSPQSPESHQLPELIFEQIDLSPVLGEDQRLAVVQRPLPDEPPQDPSPRIEISKASLNISSASRQLQLPRFDFVDPTSLTASVPPSAVEGFSLFSSAAPSPSWLSRNVQTLEVAPATNSPAPLPIPPPPSPPLYIVPRSLRPDTYYLRGPEVRNPAIPPHQRSSSCADRVRIHYRPSDPGVYIIFVNAIQLLSTQYPPSANKRSWLTPDLRQSPLCDISSFARRQPAEPPLHRCIQSRA